MRSSAISEYEMKISLAAVRVATSINNSANLEVIYYISIMRDYTSVSSEFISQKRDGWVMVLIEISVYNHFQCCDCSLLN